MGGQGRCEQRSEVFVKTKKKFGGCRVGGRVGGVRMDFFIIIIQLNVPFKISLIETSQSKGGAKREYPGKTT